MLLGDLIRGFDVRVSDPGWNAVRVCDLTEDSRTVMPGSLFIARPGTQTDGRKYIQQAIASDAAAILTTPDTQPPADLGGAAWLTSENLALTEAMIAERFFGNPSSGLLLAGVTGTNGKTTVSHLIHQMLNRSGIRCGLVGTVMIDDGGTPAKASLTTPPAIELSLTFSRMLEHGCRAAAIEVSSHSLDQGRVAALDFDIAIFTNLSGDHLDYHGTMERYAAAKAMLFAGLKREGTAIINIDDPAHRTMIERCSAKLLRCSTRSIPEADCTAEAGNMTLDGTPIILRGPWGIIDGRIRLIGSYNVMNVLQAVAAAHAAGLSRDEIALSLYHLTAPPGRLEQVTPAWTCSGARDARAASSPAVAGDEERMSYSVFVDYAHTDDALSKSLTAVRPLVDLSGGRLRVVFGCGGDRDRTKRPRMARVAASLADDVIITSDNPRTEDPLAIIDEVLAGIDTDAARSKVHVDPDRRSAITHAIESARPGDAIVIAGKGHEDYQLVPDGRGGILRLDFDDRRVACEAIISALHAHPTEANAP